MGISAASEVPKSVAYHGRVFGTVDRTIKRRVAMLRLKYLLGVSRTIFTYIEKSVALIGAIILMFWFNEHIRVYLTTNLRISQESIITIIGILVFVFWRLFLEFDTTLGSLSLKVNEIARAATSDNLIPGGVTRVYKKIDDIITEHLSKPRAATR